MDEFKTDFKYYKSRVPPPAFDDVLSFGESEDNKNISCININPETADNLDLSKYGLRPMIEWKAFTIIKKRGLIFIKNPFSGIGQRYWISRCLRDYTKKPNKLNLDVHGDLKDGQDWWEQCSCGNDNKLMKKLRWATLGYHHDWDTKVYNENDATEFPCDLRELCTIIAKIIGFPDFIPQASIVNYYHMDSTLAPHTDHSEKYLDAPLISISFGQTAIFLIGGETKDEKPLAMFLQSGDIVIMSKESRLCYHAVPRIINASEYPWENIKEGNTNIPLDLCDDSKWKPFGEYVSNSRININVRQVLEKDSSYKFCDVIR